jgi:hypothetical protein
MGADELKTLCEIGGPAISVTVNKKPMNGIMRALVEYNNVGSAVAAVEILNGIEVPSSHDAPHTVRAELAHPVVDLSSLPDGPAAPSPRPLRILFDCYSPDSSVRNGWCWEIDISDLKCAEFYELFKLTVWDSLLLGPAERDEDVIDLLDYLAKNWLPQKYADADQPVSRMRPKMLNQYLVHLIKNKPGAQGTWTVWQSTATFVHRYPPGPWDCILSFQHSGNEDGKTTTTSLSEARKGREGEDRHHAQDSEAESDASFEELPVDAYEMRATGLCNAELPMDSRVLLEPPRKRQRKE